MSYIYATPCSPGVSLTTRTLCRYSRVYTTVKFLGCFEITALNFKMKGFF